MPSLNAWRAIGISLVVLGAVCMLLGALGPSLIEKKLHQGILEQVVWTKDSPQEVHDRFENDTHPGDPPVYLKFYMFNITNLPEVQQGLKPQLEEVGPYVFRKHRVKQNIWFNDSRVRFNLYEYLLPEPLQTVGDLSEDVVVTANIPLLGVLATLDAEAGSRGSPWMEIIINMVEHFSDGHTNGMFTTRPVADILFGYEDALLHRLSIFKPGIPTRVELVHNMSAPHEATDYCIVNTGAAEEARTWEMEVWNNLTAVTSWNISGGEPVHGTDALQFRPGLALGDSVTAWAADLYRAVPLLANESVQLDGVKLLRMVADPALTLPDPRYFQRVRGLMNISSPTAAGPSGPPNQPGAPVFISWPHFCTADPALAAGVAGLACDLERHRLFLDVEPLTGITMRAAKRFQMSTYYRSHAAIDPELRDTYLPVFWAEESSQATPDLTARFKASVYRAQKAAAALHLAGFIAGCVLLTLGAVALLQVQCIAGASRSDPEWQGAYRPLGGSSPAPSALPVVAEEEEPALPTASRSAGKSRLSLPSWAATCAAMSRTWHGAADALTRRPGKWWHPDPFPPSDSDDDEAPTVAPRGADSAAVVTPVPAAEPMSGGAGGSGQPEGHLGGPGLGGSRKGEEAPGGAASATEIAPVEQAAGQGLSAVPEAVPETVEEGVQQPAAVAEAVEGVQQPEEAGVDVATAVDAPEQPGEDKTDAPGAEGKGAAGSESNGAGVGEIEGLPAPAAEPAVQQQ